MSREHPDDDDDEHYPRVLQSKPGACPAVTRASPQVRSLAVSASPVVRASVALHCQSCRLSAPLVAGPGPARERRQKTIQAWTASSCACVKVERTCPQKNQKIQVVLSSQLESLSCHAGVSA